MSAQTTPRALYLRSLDDLDRMEFVNGVAEVDVPAALLDQLPLVGAERPDTERLRRLARRIRDRGYGGGPRIVVQLDRQGRWHVIDGGHRITAARKVAGEFWTNLLGRKVATLQFAVHQAPGGG